jgi:hypothetical protein
LQPCKAHIDDTAAVAAAEVEGLNSNYHHHHSKIVILQIKSFGR